MACVSVPLLLLLCAANAPFPFCASSSNFAAFDTWRVKPLQVLLLRQRMKQAFELVGAVERNEPLGVHLSGPNGVGKSAIALLAYLLCAARGLPAVYMACAESWVDEARKEDGGHAYFLDAFWRQNADLIIEKPALRSIFAAALQDAAAPFSSAGVKALRAAVRAGAVPGLAVIMDEVQHITKAVDVVKAASAPTEEVRAGRYFATNWYDWTNDNAVFQRMSVASAHAHRDTKLSDGEAHRLRFIEPLDPDDRKVLQETPESPAYIQDLAAREHAVFIGGNVLRKVISAALLLKDIGKPTKARLQFLWTTMWDEMLADSKKWLESVPKPERTRIARTAMDVVTGKVAWSRAEQLYDAGVVFRTADSELVRPVSTVAAAVILRVMASDALCYATPLSKIADGRERGFELERQLLGQVDGFCYEEGVPAKLLDGSRAPGTLDLRCRYALPFTRLEDLVAGDGPVLYRPTSGIFPCDGILMPAARHGTRKIFLIECSTRDPLGSKRVKQVRKWFARKGIVTQLRDLYPSFTVCVVLVYDAKLADRVKKPLSVDVISLSKGEPLSASAASVAAADAATDAGNPAGPPAPAAASARVGDVVCVIDLPSLICPLRLLV